MGEASERLKVVFDCNMYLQSAANREGPAAACMEFARSGKILLIVHPAIIAEFRDVASRPKVAAKLDLTASIVEAFVDDVIEHARMVDHVPSVFFHPFDPKDNIYVDVAAASGAVVITTRDFHLLNLVNPQREESVDFRRRFPNLDVLTPIELLSRVRLG